MFSYICTDLFICIETHSFFFFCPYWTPSISFLFSLIFIPSMFSHSSSITDPFVSPPFSLFSFLLSIHLDLLSLLLFSHLLSWHLCLSLPLSLSPQWQTIWPQPGIFNGFITGCGMLLNREQWLAEWPGRLLTPRIWGGLSLRDDIVQGHSTQYNSQYRFSWTQTHCSLPVWLCQLTLTYLISGKQLKSTNTHFFISQREVNTFQAVLILGVKL